jgi:UDPglucose 6-dehydrogenase
VVDNSKPLIQKWNDHSRHFPLRDEVGLADLVRITRDGAVPDVIRNNEEGAHSVVSQARKPNLTFSSDVDGCITEADMVFICVGTPTGGNGVEVDTEPLKRAVKVVAMYGKESVVVVVKSTVPVGMAERIRKMVSRPFERHKTVKDLRRC